MLGAHVYNSRSIGKQFPIIKHINFSEFCAYIATITVTTYLLIYFTDSWIALTIISLTKYTAIFGLTFLCSSVFVLVHSVYFDRMWWLYLSMYELHLVVSSIS